MKTLSPLTVPSVTVAAIPEVTSALWSASAALPQAPAATTQMPFSAPAVWSFSSTRSPAASATPSMVSRPPVVTLTLPVEAARTEAFQSSPRATLSTYCLVAASVLPVGSATLMARWLLRSIPLRNCAGTGGSFYR